MVQTRVAVARPASLDICSGARPRCGRAAPRPQRAPKDEFSLEHGDAPPHHGLGSIEHSQLAGGIGRGVVLGLQHATKVLDLQVRPDLGQAEPDVLAQAPMPQALEVILMRSDDSRPSDARPAAGDRTPRSSGWRVG